MKDLTEMKNLLEAEKGYYSDKAQKNKDLGNKELQYFYEGKVSALEDVIKMIKERLDESFIESLVR